MGRLLDFIRRIWNFLFGKGRISEEKREEKREKTTKAITRKEEKVEKKESKAAKNIAKKLKRIQKKLNDQKIKRSDIAKESLELERAVSALIPRIQLLINTKLSIKKEEKVLTELEAYWKFTRDKLLSLKSKIEEVNAALSEIKEEANEVSAEFLNLGMDLEIEEKLSEEKIRRLKEGYQLEIKELEA